MALRFLPAPAGHGIAFQRIDQAGSEPIPARLEYTAPRPRRTALEREGVAVEMIEHVMAALAGLQIDNCLVQLDAPEVPGFDGSCLPIVDRLLAAGIVELDAPRALLTVARETRTAASDGGSEIVARPLVRPVLAISYHLDYGPRSPIPPQLLTVEIRPETFADGLAFARTFILESEVTALRAQGYGRRTTARDLLVFGARGVVDNVLKRPDECVRHKILDCLGDFALIGCDLHGYISAFRSGHAQNREMVRRLQETHLHETIASERDAA